MDALSTRLATPLLPESASVQQKCYVTYHHPRMTAPPDATISTGDANSNSGDYGNITLLESRSLISASGTTGLRTWEAALHLGRFLCLNPSIVRDRRVLELGAGTGYLSILCAGHLGATHVIASDGSDEVLNNLPDNLFLNEVRMLLPDEENQGVDADQGTGAVQLMDIKWGWALMGTEEREWNGGRPVDVLLGADVTYDRTVIPKLVGTLVDLFTQQPQVEAYISATQRNRETFDVFLDVCRRRGFRVDDTACPVPTRAEQDGPFYSDKVDIRICKVSKFEDTTTERNTW